MLVEGPYGRLHPGVRRSGAVTLVGAGIGIAPLVSLLGGFGREPHPPRVTVLYRIHDGASAVLLEEARHATEALGGRFLLFDGRRSPRHSSWLPEGWQHVGDDAGLLRLVPDVAAQDVYVCGSPEWMNLVARSLSRVGTPAERVHLERFAY